MLVLGVLFVLFDIVAIVLVVGVAARMAGSRRPRRAVTRPATTRSLHSRAMPSNRYARWHPGWVSAEEAFARHPASRFQKTSADDWAGPNGPDDDPEFLRALDQRIREMRGEGTD